MLLIGFTGIFSVTALRKIFIIDYKLAYPSGTATGVLINSLHTPAGEKRVSTLLTSLFLPPLLFCLGVKPAESGLGEPAGGRYCQWCVEDCSCRNTEVYY